jgi:hypothetical protein
LDGGPLVVREVDAELTPQLLEQALQGLLVDRHCEPSCRDVRVRGQAHELVADLARRQRKVGPARVERALRHARLLRRGRLLHERDAARGLDGAQAQRAVVARTREHHANG